MKDKLIKFCCILACLSMMGCYQYPINPKGLKNYEATRMEGLPLKTGLKYGLPYIRKYWSKSYESHGLGNIPYFPDEPMKFNLADTNTLQIAFVGDIMWMRGKQKDLVSKDVKYFLGSNNLVFGNLETPISSKHPVKKFFSDYVSYNDDTSLIQSFFKDSQLCIFNGLSLANNHAMDIGLDGLATTFEHLKAKGIVTMGASAGLALPLYERFHSKGLSVGIHAAAWGLNNPELMNKEGLSFHHVKSLSYPFTYDTSTQVPIKALAKMEQDSIDLKIVFMHWGFEFEFYPDSMIQNFAKKLSDAGADIIVGAHPHVIQPVVYLSRAHQNKPPTLVYYSLGNFCSQMYTTACKTGMIAHVAVNRNGMNQLSASALKPVFIYTQKRGWTAKKTKLHLISSLAFEKPQDLSNRKWKKIRKSLKAFE
jgi:hypothetical protein